MDSIDALLSVIGGFFLRFGIPIGITAVIVWFLRQLDQRWQSEAEQKGFRTVTASNPGCWNIHGCSEEKRDSCIAFQKQDIPCWHHFRGRDGSLKENCLGCDVFLTAPVPANP